MGQNPEDQQLRDLDARLSQAMAGRAGRDGKRGPPGAPEPTSRGMGMAFRIGTEMVVAPLVGGGIGWYLDGWLGTRPWLMIVLLIAGGAAGLLNIYRVVNGHGMSVGYQKQDRRAPADDDGNDTALGG